MNKEYHSDLERNDLFSTLSRRELDELLALAEKVEIPSNSWIFKEGTTGDEFYLLLSGQVEVLKNEAKNNAAYQIATLRANEVFGEMAFIDSLPRSASVRTIEDCVLLKFSVSKLRGTSKTKSLEHLFQKISQRLAHKIRETNEVTIRLLKTELEGEKTRVEMGKFIFILSVSLSLWVFAVTIVKHYSSAIKYSGIFTISTMVILLFLCCYHIKNSIFPISFFGINFKNWKRNLIDSFFYTLPLLGLFFFLKLFLIKYTNFYQDEKVFNLSIFQKNPSFPLFLKIIVPLIYALFVPIQEFIARGSIQSSLGVFLDGQHRARRSVILSSLLFAAFHSHLSPSFAFIAFILGCFWGWLYLKQGSLLGPVLSHELVGFWGLGVLDFGRIFIGY